MGPAESLYSGTLAACAVASDEPTPKADSHGQVGFLGGGSGEVLFVSGVRSATGFSARIRLEEGLSPRAIPNDRQRCPPAALQGGRIESEGLVVTYE